MTFAVGSCAMGLIVTLMRNRELFLDRYPEASTGPKPLENAPLSFCSHS